MLFKKCKECKCCACCKCPFLQAWVQIPLSLWWALTPIREMFKGAK